MHALLLLLGSCRQKASHDLEKEVKNLRLEFSDLHLKHKSLGRELRRHQDIDSKSKARIKRLKGNFLICFMIDHLPFCKYRKHTFILSKSVLMRVSRLDLSKLPKHI